MKLRNSITVMALALLACLADDARAQGSRARWPFNLRPAPMQAGPAMAPSADAAPRGRGTYGAGTYPRGAAPMLPAYAQASRRTAMQRGQVRQAARWQDAPPTDPLAPPATPGAPPAAAFPPVPPPAAPPGGVPAAPTEPEPFGAPPTDMPPPPGDPSVPDFGTPEAPYEDPAPPEEPTEPAPAPRAETPIQPTDGPFNFLPYDAPPDQYMECPECHGYFCNHCGAKWFVRPEIQGMHRTHSETNTGLTRGTLIANTTFGLPTVSVFSETLLDTEAADYLLEPGLRLTVGRFLGFDDRARMHSLEAAYWGGQEWQIEGQLTGRQITYIAPDLNQNGSIVPDDFVTSGNLLSFFNLEVGGFNRAEQHSFMYRSEIQNASFDYRIRWNVGRDKLVAKHDGRWVREHNAGWIHSVHGGLRYIHLDEDFQFNSRGTVSVNGGPAFPIRGEWETKTDNDLFGLQAGADLTRQWDKWSLGARGLFGVLVNFSSMDGRVLTSDPVFPFNRDPNLTDVNNQFSFTEENLAIVGETGFQAVYRLRPHWNARASYDFYWVQGVALAAEQFGDHQLTGPNAIDSDGYFFMHGPSLGLDLVW